VQTEVHGTLCIENGESDCRKNFGLGGETGRKGIRLMVVVLRRSTRIQEI